MFDYFQQLYDWAVVMIKKGKVYVDSQSSEDMAMQKEPQHKQVLMAHRNRSIEENLALFGGNENGGFSGREICFTRQNSI
jgi:glutaminyl-tRNA synthetase